MISHLVDERPPRGWLGRCHWCGKPIQATGGRGLIFCSQRCADKNTKHHSPNARSSLDEKDKLDVRIGGWEWGKDEKMINGFNRRFTLPIAALDDLIDALYILEQKQYSGLS